MFTLVAVVLLWLAASFFGRATSKEFVSEVPVALCLFVLLTAYFSPKLHQILNGSDPDITMEEGRSRGFLGPFGAPGSFLSNGEIQIQDRSLEMDHLLEHNVSNMDRSVSRLPGGFSTHNSDIALSEQAEMITNIINRVVIPNQEAFLDRSLAPSYPGDSYQDIFDNYRTPTNHSSRIKTHPHGLSSPGPLDAQSSTQGPQPSSPELVRLLQD